MRSAILSPVHHGLPAAVLLAVVVLVGCGAAPGTIDEETARVEIEALLDTYLPKLGEAYATSDPSLLDGLAAQKEQATLKLQIDTNAERGERLRPLLQQFSIIEVKVARTTAYVSTVEVWDIDRLALGSDTVLQAYPNGRYTVKYQLKKGDGWRVIYRSSTRVEE